MTEKGYTDRKSVIDGIPESFTALMKAYKIGKKSSKVGFDWDNVCGTLDKLEEEVKELRQAVENGDDETHIEEELGDVLFSASNVSRKLKFQPETVLNNAVKKYYNRFTLMVLSLMLLLLMVVVVLVIISGCLLVIMMLMLV